MKLRCALLVLTACWGCAHIDSRTLSDYTGRQATDYVIIAPTGRASLDCVAEFISFKKRQGFNVSLIEFSTDGTQIERLTAVWQRLSRCRPPQGHMAYALILASDSELPISGIRTGENEFVRSDLPLYTVASDLRPSKPPRSQSAGQTAIPVLDDEVWKRVLAPDFPWMFGRLPFEDGETLRASIRSTIAFATRAEQGPPFALLGAERVGQRSGSAWVLSRAKRRFVNRGWRAALYATDHPNDVAIAAKSGEPDVSALFQFTQRWSRDHPRVVYTLSHSGGEAGQHGRKSILGQGEYLISKEAVAAIERRDEPCAPPESPAILLTTGCGVGAPDNGLIDMLFEHGWIAAMIAPTSASGYSPLLPAIDAEVNIAECIVRGLSLGLALRVTERTYHDQSYGFFSWLLDRETKDTIATNIACFTIYGDPSLSCQRDQGLQ